MLNLSPPLHLTAYGMAFVSWPRFAARSRYSRRMRSVHGESAAFLQASLLGTSALASSYTARYVGRTNRGAVTSGAIYSGHAGQGRKMIGVVPIVELGIVLWVDSQSYQ